ncbi:MAG: tetratricopeptide repeat protein [Methanobacteriaceae archaeon]
MWKSLLILGIFDGKKKPDETIKKYLEQLWEYQEAEASILVEIATLHYENGNMEEAIEFLKEAVDIYNKIGHSEQEASILDLIGDLDMALDKTEAAIDNYRQSYKLLSSLNSPLKDDVFNKLKEFEKTEIERDISTEPPKDEVPKSTEELETPDYAKIGGKIDDIIGLLEEYAVYRTYQKYKNPMAHIKEAYDMSQSIGDQKAEAALLLIMGDISLKEEESQKALDNFLEALNICRKIGDQKGEAISRLMTGTAYFLLGDTDNGSIYLRQSMEIIKQMGDPKIEGAAMELLNSIYG